MKPFLFFIACCFVWPLSAQVYIGTLGKTPIVFEVLQENNNDFQARYYEKSSQTDIHLIRQIEGMLVFRSNEEKTTDQEIFSLQTDGGGLKGVWKKKDQKLKVNLQRVTQATLPEFKYSASFARLKTDDPYGYLKLQNIQLKKDTTTQWENNTLEWYIEPITQVSAFRFKTSALIPDLEALNTLLLNLQLEQIAASITCLDNAPPGGDYSFDCQPVYLSGQLLSIYCSSSYY